MNIESVKERIASLEAAGDLTIKERIYLCSMKEHIALAEENSLMRKLLPDYISVPSTDNFLAALRAEGANDLCKAFVLHKDLAGLDDDDKVTVREAIDAVLHCAAQLRSQSAPSPSPLSSAITDIIAERQRQQSVEGWTPEHDDTHNNGEMGLAAASYAIYAHRKPIAPAFPYHWPWDPKWFKQQGARRDLVKAGALIAAEIERIDRQSEQVKGVQS